MKYLGMLHIGKLACAAIHNLEAIVGIPIVSLGVVIGALVGLGAVSVSVSPLGEDWIL